jgi:uncharacterized protein YceK
MRSLLLVLLLSGCASVWVNPDKNEAQFTEERYACERDAAPVQDMIRASGMFARCMQAKGWRKEMR